MGSRRGGHDWMTSTFMLFTIRLNVHRLCQLAIRCSKCLCFVFVLILKQTANCLDHQWATAPQMTWVSWPHLNHPLLIFLSVPIRELSFRLSHMLKITTLVLDRTGIPMPSVILFILVILKAACRAGWVWGQSFCLVLFSRSVLVFCFELQAFLIFHALFSFGSCILRPASINFRWLLPHLNCLVLCWVGNLTNIPFKCPGLLCLRWLIKFSSVYDEMWKYSIMNFFIKSNILNVKDYFILGFLSLLGFHGVFLVFKYWKQNV